ncbi:MAG: HAD family hydrolase [Pseudomonadota bacterium]
MPKEFIQDHIAIVYDFDGTLTPRPMQDYAILPKLGIDADAFWAEVGKEVAETGAENMLVYMRLLLEKAEQAKVNITREDYAELAQHIEYFAGVEQWFDLLNGYVAARSPGIDLHHYIVSAGMKEILEGSSIKNKFSNIYASEYYFDYRGIATFPKVVITDTSKTQYLFRINKGIEDLSQSINGHMPEVERPVPFSNIIYIGDGLTDVPSMALTKKEGGHTLAVYNGEVEKQRSVCQNLLKAGRADFIAEADYREGGELHRRTRLLLNNIISSIEYERELFNCKHQYGVD